MSFVFNSAIFTSNISGNAISATTPILVATTVSGTLASSFENGDTIDGIVLATGDRILIKNQVSPTENGVYIVQASGTPLRSDDFASGTSTAGKIFPIIEGTTNADTSWVVTNDPPNDIIGTSSLVFAQITKTGAGSFVSGPGSSSIGRVALWNNTLGTLLSAAVGVSIDGSNNLTGLASIGLTGGLGLSILSASQTSSAPTITIPDLAGTSGGMVITNATQTLTNKTLTLPVISQISNTGTLSLPTSTDTLVARATSDTLTNKTLTDASNNVSANAIKTTGADVNLSSAAAPTTGQLIQASSATTATWVYQGWRQSVRVASTTDVNLASNLNGSSIDGVTVATGNRVLLKNQSTGSQNGIYVIGSGAGTTVRSTDMASGSSVSMVYFFCTSGSVSAGKEFYCSNIAGSDVVGTDILTFAIVNSSGGITGPGSSTDNAIVRWDGTGGTTVKNSSILISNTADLTGVATLVFETGTNDVTITGTTQTVGPSTITIPDLAGTSGGMVITNASQTLTNKTLTTPIITGATLSLDDTGSAFNLNLVSTSNTALTANRSLIFDVSNADRTIDLNGNLTFAADFITSGANSLTLTTTGVTNITLPTTGTLVTSPVPVANGGTGQTSYTDGQLLIGNTTGNTLTKSTLTAGNGITITNGSGAITVGFTTVTVLTSGTSISVPSGALYANITLWGGGGGGGAGATNFNAAGGGGGGGAVISNYNVYIGSNTSFTYSIGGGGGSNTAGGNTTITLGSGASALTAYGGGAGSNGTSSATGTGGGGGGSNGAGILGTGGTNIAAAPNTAYGVSGVSGAAGGVASPPGVGGLPTSNGVCMGGGGGGGGGSSSTTGGAGAAFRGWSGGSGGAPTGSRCGGGGGSAGFGGVGGNGSAGTAGTSSAGASAAANTGAGGGGGGAGTTAGGTGGTGGSGGIIIQWIY